MPKITLIQDMKNINRNKYKVTVVSPQRDSTKSPVPLPLDIRYPPIPKFSSKRRAIFFFEGPLGIQGNMHYMILLQIMIIELFFLYPHFLLTHVLGAHINGRSLLKEYNK